MKQLTILVAPINATGHINACVGTTKKLVSRGHRVVFVVEQAWKGKLTKFGIEEHHFSVPHLANVNNADNLAKLFFDVGCIGPGLTPRQRSENVLKYNEGDHVANEWLHYNEGLKIAIENYKPDVIITDENGLMPAIYYSGVPWIRHFSVNPTFFVIDPELPPGNSGLPFDDQSEWAEFNEHRIGLIQSKSFNDHIERFGYPRYPNDEKAPNTQSFIVYATPEEWNYPPLQKRPDWFNMEVFDKNELQEVVELDKLLPSEFLANNLNGNYSGKLIYVSMGSMGAIDLDLMKRLLSVLANTRHKYIVSKGPLHDQYELAGPNQWGAKFLPQVQLIPHIDLVITHGGNNSVTEIFAQGKPMIVMPICFDQFDNAQRLHETGYGVRLDPYDFTEKQLTEAIDNLLNNEKLKQKLEAATKRIQATDRQTEFAIKLEQMFGN